MNTKQPRVIIVGAGFGGLFAARALANKPVDVLLIDRNNFHTFTPLLYQVATCALDPSEIAYPVRTIFRKNRNIRSLLGTVTNIDYTNKSVSIQIGSQSVQEAFDYLILASGSVPTYFGQDAFRENSLELRTLNDALALRNHVLTLFEEATWEEDEAVREAMTTIVVVGGGPTGLETAGAIYELYNHVLNREYLHHALKSRVVLVEMQPYLLAPYPDKLQIAALEQLQSLGVEVQLGSPVQEVAEDHITLGNGLVINTRTLVWAAGVKGSPLADMLGVPLQRGGRLPILPTTEVPNRPGIYAVGDMTYLERPSGGGYPMMIPVAQQQGELAAENILAEIAGKEKRPFRYHDRGIMATIGRRRAVAWIYNKIQLRGYIAWLSWLALHLITLLGFRNRINVFVNWMWNYFTYDRSVRIILEQERLEKNFPTTDSAN
ncbi:MAG: pyridine nucleotide-disulfide oxidoreductase [Ardenticatenaceae bacterium]|nr:MAG: pyridine nucleotide-disulfide oxidoreductase [Ardenticatenaceae bacterium]